MADTAVRIGNSLDLEFAGGIIANLSSSRTNSSAGI